MPKVQQESRSVRHREALRCPGGRRAKSKHRQWQQSTLLTKGSHGDVSLWPKTLEKQKMRGREGKILEKCGKKEKKKEGTKEKGEKKENCRKNGENERTGGQKRTGEKKREGKVEKSRGPTFTRKATMFEPPRQKTKKCGKNHEKSNVEQSAHWFVITNRPKWHLHKPRRQHVLTTVLKFAKCHKTPPPPLLS